MPKKILYLQVTSEIGGTDITLLRTVELIDRAKFEVHVLFRQEGPLTELYRKAGCRIHFLPSMSQLSSRRGLLHLILYVFGYFSVVFQMVGIINREKIDVVHTNTIHNLYGFMAARIAARPHIWHDREIVVQSRLIRVLEKFLVPRFSTYFIVMSDSIGDMFRSRSGDFPSNAIKLYDGIDLQTFNPSISGARIRRELGIPASATLVGMVCRLDPWKGTDLFLEAAAHVQRMFPETYFLICGGEIKGHEGYESQLKDKAARLGVKNCFFTGWQYKAADIPEVYGALDISVQCPILPEPYGLAAIEAMASGVPVVAPREGGPAELCVDQETAFLVRPREASALAVALQDLLSNPARAKAMGEAGRARAEKVFDRRHWVKKLEELYDKAL